MWDDSCHLRTWKFSVEPGLGHAASCYPGRNGSHGSNADRVTRTEIRKVPAILPSKVLYLGLPAIVWIRSLRYRLRRKKDGTNVFCSCREASDANYFQLRCDPWDRSPALEYLHLTIDFGRSKYKILNFFMMRYDKPLEILRHLRAVLSHKID